MDIIQGQCSEMNVQMKELRQLMIRCISNNIPESTRKDLINEESIREMEREMEERFENEVEEYEVNYDDEMDYAQEKQGIKHQRSHHDSRRVTRSRVGSSPGRGGRFNGDQ